MIPNDPSSLGMLASGSGRLPVLAVDFDVCVIGGGMAGLCAAVAAARHGARVALIHDRPVLGGNASSEVRMHICGAHGRNNKEGGILEELQLANVYRNPDRNWSIWDSVLYEKVRHQPGLELFLNASCLDARLGSGRIESVLAWQLTTQTWIELSAKFFIDCSGDSILAPLSGAEVRAGRESREEFGEDIAPRSADRKTMGNSVLVQLRQTDQPRRFVAPSWAYRIDDPSELEHRLSGVHGHNFWWLEVGGLQDTIADAEDIRDELYRVAYGVVDYIKNRAPERAEAESWAVEWIGALPGKRENRRYVGDHVLTQHDIRSGGVFRDIVAYGGWSMDDHHPAGIFYPGKPTVFHPAPSPYGIPFRCLYSCNVENLLCAGRNISVTHVALSSTRVMGTCALLGQAAGTAAALCVRHACAPHALLPDHLHELQAILMDDDCWLPGHARECALPAVGFKLDPSAGILLDGWERDEPGKSHAWEGELATALEWSSATAVPIEGLRLVLDSAFDDSKRMPAHLPHTPRSLGPHLLRQYRVEVRDRHGSWRVAYRAVDNHERLVRAPVKAEATGVRLIPEQTWGGAAPRIFAFEPMLALSSRLPVSPPRIGLREVQARLAPTDLAPPDHGLEAGSGGSPRFSA